MKKFALFLLLFLVFPVLAQADEDALLLFTRSEGDIVRVNVLNVTSGEERLIIELGPTGTPNAYDFGWSPDGRIWAFTDLQTERNVLQLHLFDAKTGEESLFKEAIVWNVCSSSLGWSPDGRYWVYATAIDYKTTGLAIYNVQDETSYTLPWIGALYPYWSPDGNYMQVIDNYYALSNPDANTARLLRAADAKELLGRGQYDNSFNFAYSPDSRFFAYEEDDSAWVYEFATGESTNLEIPTDMLKWSPTGQFLLIGAFQEGVDYAIPQYVYEAATATLNPLALDEASVFAQWADESTILLRTDFKLYPNKFYPKKLISYDLITNEVKTIFTRDGWGWINQGDRQGDWYIVNFNFAAENYAEANTEMLFINGETKVKLDYHQGGGYAALAWSPDRRWLVVKTEKGMYRFDSQEGNLEALQGNPLTNLTFWSPDSHYLAFKSQNQLKVWNTESNSVDVLADGISDIIGWQYGRDQVSLLCPYGYGDGNA